MDKLTKCFHVDLHAITKVIYNWLHAGLHTHLLIFRGLETQFLEHFEDFGITLAVICCKGALRRTLGCPMVNFRRFLMDFGSPIGDTFDSPFVILCALRCQKVGLDCRRDS